MFAKGIRRACFILFLSVLTSLLSAQAFLPEFQVVQRNGLNIVSWSNENKELSQLIIQRSSDSINGFRSIVSMPDPSSPTNGFVDKKAGNATYYYRIFYVMPGSRYVFTASKKPSPEVPKPTVTTTPPKTESTPKIEEIPSPAIKPKTPEPTMVPKKIPDSSESRLTLTDQNIGISQYNWKKITILPKPDNLMNDEIFTLSSRVFTNGEGNLVISLADAPKHRYTLRVFREDKTLLFEMKNIRETELLVDRSNFHSSGWFRYELKEGEKIKEKNRFYIKPEGK